MQGIKKQTTPAPRVLYAEGGAHANGRGFFACTPKQKMGCGVLKGVLRGIPLSLPKGISRAVHAVDTSLCGYETKYKTNGLYFPKTNKPKTHITKQRKSKAKRKGIPPT